MQENIQKLDFNYLAKAKKEELFEIFKTGHKGLFQEEVNNRLEEYGHNEPVKKKRITIIKQFFTKFLNPLVVVLLIIAGFSLFFGEKISSILVSVMALISVFLSFAQEYKAGKEAEKLSEMVSTTATVYRNGKTKEVEIRDIVPGDILDLFAGDMIPADLRIISSKDLYINQASLTGESLPVEKHAQFVEKPNQTITEYQNIAFMGSSVISGTALGLVVKTGIHTQFGELSKRLVSIRTETSFEKGIKKFTWLMINTMFVLVVLIFLINVLGKRDNLIDAFLFSLAVAIGLTPEMLPMIVAINLSQGAIEMSKKLVIVKRLNSIQNIGAMDVLCTDKTGTLTKDKIILEKYCDVTGKENEEVLNYAYINSFYQTGLKNLLDQAILKHRKVSVESYRKVDEIPFDFTRKVMSVVVEVNEKHLLIVKGAPEEIFKRCSAYWLDGEIKDVKHSQLAGLKEEYNKLSAEGFRVLAVAYKELQHDKKEIYSTSDEHKLILKGYVAFLDPPKNSTRRALYVLSRMGIEVKILTGDNELVTKHICSKVGLDVKGMVTGDRVAILNNQDLQELVKTTTVFARVSPSQKERIIQALQANNHTVGFLGDGINDAPALKAADVGISVDNAVDIAKESADIILLKKSLMVLEDGVMQGRRIFGNIIKYIKMSSSSNFGNMLSMTGASLFLPFLPMAPIQILLNNFLYDLSQVAIPTDKVDKEYLSSPKPWNVNAIKKFMVIIGPVSSLFDFLTYGVLLFLFNASAQFFHTGWFIESLCTQALVIHIIRTNKIPFLESMPSRFLISTSVFIVLIGIFITQSPVGKYFGFVPMPWMYFSVLINILILYLFLVQVVKQWFIRKIGRD